MLKTLLSLLLLALFGGCQTQPKPARGEKSEFFPVWSICKTQENHDNGNVARTNEKGSVLLVANWCKHAEYDKEGQLTRRDEESVLFPVWTIREHEDETKINKRGSILLLFNYNDEIKKPGQ
jgi:hypothetical protein